MTKMYPSEIKGGKMVQGCGNKCIKYFFVAINLVLFVLGGVVCGLALWVRFDNDFQKKVFDMLNIGTDSNSSTKILQMDTMYIILYAIAAVGLLIFILGFLGCCGSLCESICVIGIYFTLILVMFVVLLAGGIFVAINKGNIRQEFINVWQAEFVNKYNTLPLAISQNVNNIHTQLKCCGANGCHDFTAPPASCNCTYGVSTYIRKGCAVAIYELIDSNILIILIVGIAILVIELLAMIFACILCNALKEKSNMSF
ncbi:hypothetical protein PFISCL1PPCAC_27741 [Pristionchus fissidentatus]|uniref:Tetraspanin n=1 Tax=Pristionchus fissidentatus TaxID=1538716 RepID=A0AAV5X3A3_9BILA|nr:hypothetical protein PFISCL1PPCAC_27741 [Pristionchus fissidentatus]